MQTPDKIHDLKKTKIFEYDDWRSKSNCKETNVDMFFHEERRLQFEVASQFCYNCPVRLECLEYAIICEERDGVWGGVPPYIRRDFERKLRHEYEDQPLHKNGVIKDILSGFLKKINEFESYVSINGKPPRKKYTRKD